MMAPFNGEMFVVKPRWSGDNLHHDTRTCIKWKQQVSDSFDCQQRVKQGGLLSAELCKLYIEDLLRTRTQK
jgi:hypothetical protein